MSEALLDELLVVDLSHSVAGAYCCLLFARLGAEVVSVDPPDGARREAAGYVDAGKKSITLDASKTEGAVLLFRLAERADVLVCDAPLPSKLDREALSRQNPRLILTFVTPPAGNDLFAQYFTGLNAFAATLLPLVNMSILGRGQHVEVDGAECLASAAFVVDRAGEWPAKTAETFPPPPFRVTGLVEGPLSSAPGPGEHNDEVYCGLLGLTGEEMARLKEASVV